MIAGEYDAWNVQVSHYGAAERGQPNVISVNPLLVCYLRPAIDDRTTTHFDDTHATVVDEPIGKVEEALNVALNSDHL